MQDYDSHHRSDDGSLKPDHASMRWVNMLLDASEKNGRTACPGPQLAGWLRDAGFENVHETVLKVPIGPWPREKRLVSFPEGLAVAVTMALVVDY
jgi:hypothetical protein